MNTETKPADIPDDVRKAADEACRKAYDPATETWFDVRDTIARAIMAERERWQAKVKTRPHLRAEPLFWYRPVGEDGGYEGPHHAQSELGKLFRSQKPEQWKPLYSSPSALDLDPALIGIAEVMKESGGGWRPCSGCFDTEDGHPTRQYDHSPSLQTDIGLGCHECGGLGATWEYYSEQDIADLLADEASLAAAPEATDGQ